MEELPASIEQLKLELSSLSEEGRKQDIRKRIVQLQLKLQRMKEVCDSALYILRMVSGAHDACNVHMRMSSECNL